MKNRLLIGAISATVIATIISVQLALAAPPTRKTANYVNTTVIVNPGQIVSVPIAAVGTPVQVLAGSSAYFEFSNDRGFASNFTVFVDERFSGSTSELIGFSGTDASGVVRYGTLGGGWIAGDTVNIACENNSSFTGFRIGNGGTVARKVSLTQIW